MRVECVKEFHSKEFPEKNFGVLFAQYDVQLARYGMGCTEPMHYKMFFGIDDWVNAERFKVVS